MVTDTTTDDRLIELRLSSPDAGGRIDARTIDELNRTLAGVADDASLSFVVLTGLAGADLAPELFADVQAHSRWERLVGTLERLPQVTIAVIDGDCRSAGLDLALACDCRLAAAEGSVQLQDVKQGVLPCMVLFRLPKYVGMGVAKRMALTGARWSAESARAAGLLDVVVPRVELGSALAGLLDEYSPVSSTAITMARRLVHESYATTAEDAVGNYLAAQHRCLWKNSVAAGTASD